MANIVPNYSTSVMAFSSHSSDDPSTSFTKKRIRCPTWLSSMVYSIPKDQKHPIILNEIGQPIGGEVVRLSNTIGIEARKFSLYYFSWNEVYKIEKSQLLNTIMVSNLWAYLLWIHCWLFVAIISCGVFIGQVWRSSWKMLSMDKPYSQSSMENIQKENTW